MLSPSRRSAAGDISVPSPKWGKVFAACGSAATDARDKNMAGKQAQANANAVGRNHRPTRCCLAAPGDGVLCRVLCRVLWSVFAIPR